MIRLLLIVFLWFLVFGLALLGAVMLFGLWGALTFRELPLFSEGDEPTTVKRLPEIDLPLPPADTIRRGDDPC